MLELTCRLCYGPYCSVRVSSNWKKTIWQHVDLPYTSTNKLVN